MSRPSIRTFFAATAAALLLAACGGDGATSGGADPSDGVLAVVGRDVLQWDVDTLAASAGTVTFELTCEAGVNHNLVIEELDQEVAACAPGETDTGSIDLEPGEYTYVCTVPGHETTMRGTLTVS